MLKTKFSANLQFQNIKLKKLWLLPIIVSKAFPQLTFKIRIKNAPASDGVHQLVDHPPGFAWMPGLQIFQN